MNLEEINNVVNKYKFRKKIFPIPIILGIKKKIDNKFINLYYNNKKITKIEIENIFKLNLEKIFKKFVGKKFQLHPLYKYYKQYNYFISSNPLSFKKKRIKKKQSVICFATRNKPHIGHKKIIKYF